jgi:hypothetical protein
MSHAMIHRMSETRLLSYIEIAKLFDMTVPSARNMVRKRCWSRILSNDGKTVRVNVPCDALPPPPSKPANASPDDAHDGSPDAPSEVLAILAKHIEALQAELAPLRATATQVAALNAALDAARDEARRLRVEADEAHARGRAEAIRAAALAATLEAVTGERDRLLTREQLRVSRSWWRRLTG